MTETNMQRIGKAMKAARLEAGREQGDMAARLGISQSMISRFEDGKSKPSITQVLQWALACGMPAGELVDRIVARMTGEIEPHPPYAVEPELMEGVE